MGETDVNEVRLIERARRGDREAFDKLYADYERQVYGFIRARAYDDADTQELAQQTWLAVWQKLPTYHQVRRNFRSFAKYWASIMLLRYYEACGRQRRMELLCSELVARFPDLEREEEIGEVIARLTAHANRSAEEELLVNENEMDLAAVYKDLLLLTFNGSSPPHQLLAFGFAKLLAWAPRKIVAELSEVFVKELEQQLETDYLNISHLPADQVQPCFKKLREQIDQPFCTAVTDLKTRKTYTHLLDRLVGTTTLRDYYTGKTAEQHAADVTQWWDAVKRRVWSAVQGLTQGPLLDLLQKKSEDRLREKAITPVYTSGEHKDEWPSNQRTPRSAGTGRLLCRAPARRPRTRPRSTLR